MCTLVYKHERDHLYINMSEQILKMMLQHQIKMGNWKHVQYVQCAVYLLHRRYFYEFRRNRVHLQYTFWWAYNFYVQPSVSYQLSFHTKTRINFIYAYIFWYLAICITLIAKLLSTLCTWPGLYYCVLLKFYKRKFITAIVLKSSSIRVIYLSSFIFLSYIYHQSIYHPFIIYLSSHASRTNTNIKQIALPL